MLHAEIARIDEALLIAACGEHWAESHTLDFKRALPGTDDKSRHEFLKDVYAFANASGGDLVYGIQEQAGHADQIVPISTTSDPVDATRRRLGQVLEAGLEPRLEGLVMHTVTLAGGGYALVVRVPASFQRPHRYRMGAITRWVVRTDTHIVDLTYDQIREAFERTSTLADRARQFRERRVGDLLSGSNGWPLRAGPRCVVHLIPLAAMAGKATIDVRTLYTGPYQQFMFRDWNTGAGRSLNLDGLVVYPGQVNDIAYSLIFRAGMFEAARFGGILNSPDPEVQSNMSAGVVSGFIRDAIAKFLDAAHSFGIGGPAIVGAALVDIRDHRWWYQPRGWFTQRNPTDRPNLMVPEAWIEQLATTLDPDSIARPLLDTLWQAFDMEGCAFYNAQGSWEMH
jgi:hypothetical protein